MRSANFYKWRGKYGGMDSSMVARMKQLEAEDRRLKKMYAEELLKAKIVQEALAKIVSPSRPREMAAWLIRLTQAYLSWGSGLCFMYVLNVKGYGWNHKRVYRIYLELELNLRIKPKKRIVREKPNPAAVPKHANESW